MITITVVQPIFAPVNQIVEVLLNHAQLGRFFNAKISQLTPENVGELKGGRGAIRFINIGKISFKEQIVSATYEHICYQIIGNKPVANHQGNIYLTTQYIADDLMATSGNSNHRVSHDNPVIRKPTNYNGEEKSTLEQSYTHIEYKIQFNGVAWLPNFILKFLVKRDICIAMQRLADYFKKQQLHSKTSAEVD